MKDDELYQFVERTAYAAFGKYKADAHSTHTCISCKKGVNVNEFPDELSEKEYWISALCFSCQENYFSDE